MPVAVAAPAQTARFAGAVSRPSASANQQAIDAADATLRTVLADIAAGRESRDLLAAGQFSPVEPGGSDAGTTLIFAFNGSGVLGKTTVFTKGQKSEEFRDAGTGTCKPGMIFKPGDTCTVELAFAPSAPGTRYCAVDLNSESGSLLAIGYAYGTGIEPKSKDNVAENQPDSRAGLEPKKPHGALSAQSKAETTDQATTSVTLTASAGTSTTSSATPTGVVQLSVSVATSSHPTPTGSITFYAAPQKLSFVPTTNGPLMALGEGWTNDGTFIYSINNVGFYKSTNNAYWSVVTSNLTPFVGLDAGLTHLGDGKYYNGLLYIPAETWAFAGACTFKNQTIAVFSATATGMPLVHSRDVSADGHEMSAVAVVPTQNALYVTSYCDGTKIWIYDLATLAFKGTLSLSQNIARIQGLTYNPATDSLFMSADGLLGGDQYGGEIYEVSFKGVVTPVLAVPGPGELEGLDFMQGSLGYAMGGRVHFFSGGPAALGTAALNAGAAKLSVGTLPTGADTVTATYSGDILYAPAASNAVAITITRANPALTATPSAGAITTGQPLTVSVRAGAANPVPTGLVTLSNGTYTSSAVSLSAGKAVIGIPAWSLAAGAGALTITYNPDAASAPTYNSQNVTASVAVTAALPDLAATPSASSISAAQPLSVAVKLVTPAGAPAPTGTVSLSSGGYTSPAVPVSQGSAAIVVPAFSLPTGTDTLTIVYAPDAASLPLYGGATVKNSIAVSKITPALALAPSAQSVASTQAMTATVAVSSVANSPVPTGKVTLVSGSFSASATLVSGIGTINVPAGALAVGNNTLSATYTPDAAGATAYVSAVTASSVTVSNSTAVASPVSVASSTSQSFGTLSIGSTSAAHSFNFSIPAGTTLGSAAVLTMGAPQLDFAATPAGTCIARTYPTATTCTVNVTFTPKAAGSRLGSVVLFGGANNAGAILASVPLSGFGSGPQIGSAPASATVLASLSGATKIGFPSALAVDGLGNVFVADPSNNRVIKAPAHGGAPISIAPLVDSMSLAAPAGLAVDGAGDLFIADQNNRVVRIPSGGGTPVSIAPIVNNVGLYGPAGLAVDGAGNLYIADANNNRVVLILWAGGKAVAIAPLVNGVGLSEPAALALDGAGDLFIADTGNNRVVEVVLATGVATAVAATVNGTPLSSPVGLAVDGAGAVYIAQSAGRLVEVPATGAATYPFAAAAEQGSPAVIAFDAWGNFYAAPQNSSQVLLYPRADPQPVNFATATAVGLKDSTDGTQTVKLVNIGNAPLTLNSLIYPADFALASGDSEACALAAVISVGQGCDLPVSFVPEQSGSLSENVAVGGSAPNGGTVQQNFPVSGVGLADHAAVMVSPATGYTLSGTTLNLQWTGGVGVTYYDVWVGENRGSANVYNSYGITSTSLTVTVPAHGVTLFVRLSQLINGVWQNADYTYTESGTTIPAVISSPAPGTALSGSSATFNWPGGAGPFLYSLSVGTKGAGSSNILYSGATNATSATVTLPASGTKVYVRLSQLISSVWSSTDYQYTVQ